MVWLRCCHGLVEVCHGLVQVLLRSGHGHVLFWLKSGSGLVDV